VTLTDLWRHRAGLSASAELLVSDRFADPDFLMKCSEVMLFGGLNFGISYGSVNVVALSDWRQRMMHRMSGYTRARRKDNDQQNLSKMIM